MYEETVLSKPTIGTCKRLRLNIQAANIFIMCGWSENSASDEC